MPKEQWSIKIVGRFKRDGNKVERTYNCNLGVEFPDNDTAPTNAVEVLWAAVRSSEQLHQDGAKFDKITITVNRPRPVRHLRKSAKSAGKKSGTHPKDCMCHMCLCQPVQPNVFQGINIHRGA